MKKLLSSPKFNATCIALFTAFYGLIFILTSGHAEFENILYYNRAEYSASDFWKSFSNFLSLGYQAYIAYAVIALTLLVVLLLLLRRKPYDEYHVSLLVSCLTVALVLTMIAIAVFYLMILSSPNGIVEKFTLFVIIHWVTVVSADLFFVLLCRWR